MAEQNLDMVRGTFDAFTDRDLGAVLLMVAEDVEFLPVTANVATGGLPYLGHDGIRQYFDDVARLWDELRLFPDDIYSVGDSVVVALGRVYARGGGMIVDRPVGWVWVISGGKIASGRVWGTHEEAVKAAAAIVRGSAMNVADGSAHTS